uniref:ubiquitinyl hydrolase 1 n=1 Tax=Cercocebus atys TaxID=9531 RepID=A0A2K5MGD8_CERAT
MKRAAMALHSPQYICGDFSPDEFNQFFVTSPSSVKLPPYSGTVLCGTQAVDKLPDGQEYQRIEFGVNEVIESSDTLPRTPSYSISSTLNPQAPEFILNCRTSKTTPDGITKEANYGSIDCQYPGSALALDGSSNVEAEVLENDGVSGGLGQRERKKKKKWPPGYYSYLKDGGDDSISTKALVNGHASSAVPNSVSAEDADFMGDMPPSVTPRTCNSPQNSTDSVSDTVPDSPFPGALSSDTRTGVPGANFGQSCFSTEADRDTLSRTAGAQPCVGTDTTENLGVANGQILESSGEGTPTNGVELHTTESIDLDPTKPESASPPADGTGSTSGTLPVTQPKSWASLFHDSKPSSSSLAAYVETKYSPPAVSPLVSVKQVEVKEGVVATPRADHAKASYVNTHDRQLSVGDKIVRGIHLGAAFEPTCIYRLLAVNKSSLPEKGRQDDAEEYLGFILNGLHEELLNLKKLSHQIMKNLRFPMAPKTTLLMKKSRKNKVKKARMNGASGPPEQDFRHPPGGVCSDSNHRHFRSVVYQQLKESSIQCNKIRTPQDALESLVARESVQGYTTKTKQEVEISRRVTLEKLPPLLVLHLKRFVYKKTGGCQKLTKNIEYPVDLEISKELLSPGVKNKNFKCHRTHWLVAVVYHHSNSATGGQSTTDVFQIGLNGWLRIDDQTLKVINQYQVVKPTAEHTAYLLYYCRVDLV